MQVNAGAGGGARGVAATTRLKWAGLRLPFAGRKPALLTTSTLAWLQESLAICPISVSEGDESRCKGQVALAAALSARRGFAIYGTPAG